MSSILSWPFVKSATDSVSTNTVILIFTDLSAGSNHTRSKQERKLHYFKANQEKLTQNRRAKRKAGRRKGTWKNGHHIQEDSNRNPCKKTSLLKWDSTAKRDSPEKMIHILYESDYKGNWESHSQSWNSAVQARTTGTKTTLGSKPSEVPQVWPTSSCTYLDRQSQQQAWSIAKACSKIPLAAWEWMKTAWEPVKNHSIEGSLGHTQIDCLLLQSNASTLQ